MSNQENKLTVAICTHNRSELLIPLINELLEKTKDDSFTILIVDNSSNPKDRTAADKMAVPPQVEVIYSDPPGLSRARNTAIENCKTSIIAFLDDDAIPLANWSKEICKPFDNPKVGFVAGPIIPIWPEAGKPDWIPEQYIGCLTVLDMGESNKNLEPYEYAYGANMAFRLSAIKKTGGFNVSLGRNGNNTLLSNEEIDVQDTLRQQGYLGLYSSNATVHHLVETERLTKHWFLSRMAWQGVSTAFQDGNINQKALLTELQNAAEKCGFGNLPSALLNETEPEKLGNNLNFVRLLFSYLLQAKKMSDNTSTIKPARTADNNRKTTPYCPSAATSPNTKYLFFDGRPGHHYLYNLYGEIEGAQFVIAETNQWELQKGQDISFLEHSINTSVEAIIFLTLDPYLYGPNFPYYYDMIKRQSRNRRIYGFIHRPPKTAYQIEHLTRVAPHISFILLDESLQEIIQNLAHTKRAYYLPHHAVLEHYLIEKDIAKKRRNIPNGKTIISMLGEIREGKGINRLFDCLHLLSPEVKENVAFLIVGNAKDINPKTIKKAFTMNNIDAVIISEKLENNYKLVPDPELGEYVSASDIGLLLFEKDQKTCMSGILPNYIMSDIPVISSENSIVGQYINKNLLGWTTNISNPKCLADTIVEAVKSNLHEKASSSIKTNIKEKISNSSVRNSLEGILKSEDNIPH